MDPLLLQTAALLGAIFLFRLAPVLAYATISRELRLVQKAALITCVVAVATLLEWLTFPALEVALRSLAELAFFAVIAGFFCGLRNAFARGRITRSAIFALGLVGFVFLPAKMAPGSLGLEAMALGWEMMFASYSYCLDTRARRHMPLGEGLFFILVNPTLVYSQRGHKTSAVGFSGRGLLRCAQGAITLVAQAVCIWLMNQARLEHFQPLGESAQALARTSHYVLWALSLYFAHSALASIQIGLMAQLGWTIPERYHFPFLACSPTDFWRRWNIWLGAWARKYLFLPLALRGGRTFKRRQSHRIVAQALAVLITFLAIGVLHDCAAYAASPSLRVWPRFGMTVAFAAAACLLLAWELLARLAPSIPRHPVARPFARVLQWVAFAHAQAVLIWFALPALAHGDLPPQIRSWFERILGF